MRGKIIPGLTINGRPAPYPVLNERAVRATAGLLLIATVVAFSLAFFQKNFLLLKIITPILFVGCRGALSSAGHTPLRHTLWERSRRDSLDRLSHDGSPNSRVQVLRRVRAADEGSSMLLPARRLLRYLRTGSRQRRVSGEGLVTRSRGAFQIGAGWRAGPDVD
jgi:hypothetical protein